LNFKTSKIGFSEIGGLFIGKDIKSDFHKHYAISIIISFGKSFKITASDKKQEGYKIALIQKNVDFGLETSKDDYVAFIHIAPYSDAGVRLSDNYQLIQSPDYSKFLDVLTQIKEWFYSEANDQEIVRNILQSISLVINSKNNENSIDKRILKAINLIMMVSDDKLGVNIVANEINLSVSHFNRLLKKETGLSFRRFVLHSKLIKSIYAIYDNVNLTKASYIGGFSDQPHLTRTFKENFGIKPSKTIK
jgi:AraC-like DNA-binding protein